MTENAGANRSTRPIGISGVILSSLPSLLLRFGVEFLRFKSKAKKGARIFQKELIYQGLAKTTAKKLTDTYLEGSDLIGYLKRLR
jgi:hypothetical protein